MRTKKTNAIIAIVSIAVISILSSILIYILNDSTESEIIELALETEQPTCYIQETITPVPTPTPTSTPMPEEPRYIFYVIGDGMGFSHLVLGDVYEKILHEDSSYISYWDRFNMKKSVTGGLESPDGGTMIATGYDGVQGVISQDAEGNDLVTILDRAYEAGLSTGVISNSYITDATPATFLSHVGTRSDYKSIVGQMPLSNVNYISSGGMNYFLDTSFEDEFGKSDIRDMDYIYKGDENAISKFDDNGYSTYLGKAAAEFANQDNINMFDGNKLFMLFVSKNMSYQYNKYGSRKEEKEVHEPDLDDMTRIGIDLLSKNENGFVFVIEEALIDKASHNLWTRYVAAEMHMMNKTLEVIYDFYQQHPYETLIIFTADHETGDMSYDEDFVGKIPDLPDINWHIDSDEIFSFLKDDWQASVSKESIVERKELALQNIWESDEKNYTYLHSYIAAYLCESNGITINSEYHSRQKVPLYTLGVKSDYFSECENIYEISPIVCEIMGWKPLPEIIKQ